jgi:hypothetical protein
MAKKKMTKAETVEWMNEQRRLYAMGLLSKDKIELMEEEIPNFNWELEPKETDMEIRFKLGISILPIEPRKAQLRFFNTIKERCGVEVTTDVMLLNIQGVDADIKSGRTKKPDTFDGMIEACIIEFVRNHETMAKGFGISSLKLGEIITEADDDFALFGELLEKAQLQ